MIYSTEKSLKEHGDKVGAADRQSIEQAVADLRGVLDSEDTEGLRSKTEHLAQVSMKLGEAMYRAQAEAGGGPSGDGGGPSGHDGAAGGGERAPEEGVVDADFEEVEDDKKKSA